MSVIYMDGMDLYANSAGLARRGYTGTPGSPNGFQTTGGRFGGGCISLDANANPFYIAAAAGDTYSCGFAFKTDTMASYTTGKGVVGFYNGGAGGTLINKIGVDVNGALVFGRGDFTTNKVLASANGLITTGVWNFVEVVVTRHASAGAVAIYFNGSQVASTTGVNTGSASIDTLAFAITGDNPNGSRYLDDMFCTNTAVSLGDCKVETIRPTADTATKQWTRSTGSNNFANVDDTGGVNDDSDYNSSSTVGQKDLFDMADLGTTPSSIYAVQAVLVSRKDDATTRELRTNMKNGSTTTNGTTRGQATTYSNFVDLYTVNPDTAAAFTPSDVNSLQLGYEVVT